MSRLLRQRALGIIDGRDRIPALEAAQCMGRAWEGALKDYGLRPDDHGTVAAADIIAAIDRADVVRRDRNRPRWDARVAFSRTGPTAWDMLMPWGRVGDLELVAYVDGALASPAPILGVWLAAWPATDQADPDVVNVAGAVSARAAQVIILRATCPQVVLPDWAEHVRPLGDDLALDAQRVAQAQAGGQPTPETDLTAWEVAEIVGHKNPRHTLWRQDLSHRGLDAAEDGLADGIPAHLIKSIPDPDALFLATTSNPASRRWGYKAVAAFLSTTRGRTVKPATVRGYASRGLMPAPDGTSSNGSPWWRPETIREWNANRPGSGRWGRPNPEG